MVRGVSGAGLRGSRSSQSLWAWFGDKACVIIRAEPLSSGARVGSCQAALNAL